MEIIYKNMYIDTYNRILLVHLDTRTTYTKLTATLTTSNRFLHEVTMTAQSVQSKGRQGQLKRSGKPRKLLPVRRDKRMLRLHSMDRIRIHALHYTTATTTIIRIALFGSSRALAVPVGPTFSLGNSSCTVLDRKNNHVPRG